MSASACSASTWSVRTTSANRRWITFSKLGATPGVPRLSIDDDREARLGPPLLLQPARPRRDDLLVPRAAVDVDEDRQLAPGDVAAGVEHAGRQPAIGHPVERGPGRVRRGRGEVLQRADLRAAAPDRPLRTRRSPATRTRRRASSPPTNPMCQPGSVVSRVTSTPDAPAPASTRNRCCSLGSPVGRLDQQIAASRPQTRRT